MGNLAESGSFVVTPARVDLSAGFPDVEPFCTLLPGLIVNAAVDLEVTVATADRGPGPDGLAASLLCEIATRLGVPPPDLACRAPAPMAGLVLSNAVAE